MKNLTAKDITLVVNELNQLYQTGDRVTNKDLKHTIQLIYDKLGYKCKAKGTDIKLYGYSTKKVKIRIDDKRLDGVELIRTEL